MAPHDMYKLFKGQSLQPGRAEQRTLPETRYGTKSAPAGTYWVARAPAYMSDNWVGPITGDALSKLRPALKDTDTTPRDNPFIRVPPTEYAKRWGLHEDGPRGRSRTSLTRSETRTFLKYGLRRPVSGRWLAEYFESKAAREDMDLREWLQESLPNMELGEDDRVYLDWLEELLRDEVWQGMLFNDFTSDELHEGDVFTMRDDIGPCSLKGPLHPILRREKWLSPSVDSNFGTKFTEPRWLYKVGDKEGEYDPRTNDELWEAMQPALLLATKVLDEKPDFLSAILRVWDHKVMPPTRDTRAFKAAPLKTFDTVSGTGNEAGIFPETQFLRRSADRYVDALWEVVARDLKLHIHAESDQCAVTNIMVDEINDRRKIPGLFVAINPNLVFPLLVGGYSSSEKTMASFYLAATVLHELAHAFHFVAKEVLYRPDILPHGAVPAEDYPKFDAAARAYCDMGFEIYFRDEPVCELGYSFENWLFGGVSGCLTINNHRDDVQCLGFQSIALRSERFPFFRVHDKTKTDPNASRYCGPILDAPTYHADELFANVPIRSVAPYFQEAFWVNGVGAYGLKALRMHAAMQEVKVTMSLLENRIGEYSKFYSGLENVKDLVNGVCTRLRVGGHAVALNYLNALIVERLRFPMAVLRWEKQESLFLARSHRAAPDLWTAKTLALERRILKTFLEMCAQGTPEGMISGFVVESHRAWGNHVARLPGRRPPRGSEALAGTDPVRFIKALGGVVAGGGCQRYLACLPDAYAFLMEELQHLEHAVFDAYMLDDAETAVLLGRFGGAWSSHVDGLATICRAFAADTGLFGGENDDIPHWTSLLQQLATQLATMKQYLVFEADMVNPTAMRHLFLSMGRGNGARRTPSARWAAIVGEQVAKMPVEMKVQFEQAVQLVTQHTGELPPHKRVQRLRNMGSENALPVGAPGAFGDLVRELQEDPEVAATEVLMQYSLSPREDDPDMEALRTAVRRVDRRRELRDDIRQLETALEGSREVRGREDEVYRTQQSVLNARRRCEAFERQVEELKQRLVQHQTAEEQVRLRARIGVLNRTLAEMLSEVKRREGHAAQATRDPASEARIKWEGRVEDELQLLRREEWKLEREGLEASPGARSSSVSGPRVNERAFPPRFRKRRRAEAFESEGESGPGPKRRCRDVPVQEPELASPPRHKHKRKKQLRSRVIRSLLKDPPFLGGPMRIAGRPLPFGRSAQLRMPHGGLPDVRYEVKPLRVGGPAAIDLVEALADAVEGWRVMGKRQRYLVPRGGVAALADVAGSERSGLPAEPVQGG